MSGSSRSGTPIRCKYIRAPQGVFRSEAPPAPHYGCKDDPAQRITREVDHAQGFAARPINRSEAERKFRGNVGGRWAKEQTDANLKALWAIDQIADLAPLLGRFALP